MVLTSGSTSEGRLSDLVNDAYGLTPEDVALMWATAPPRMPFTPANKGQHSQPDLGAAKENAQHDLPSMA